MATDLVDEDLLVLVGVGIDDVLEGALIWVLEATVVVYLEDKAEEEDVEEEEVEDEEVEEDEVEAAMPIVVRLGGVPIAQN
jgi:hypothetical protein